MKERERQRERDNQSQRDSSSKAVNKPTFAPLPGVAFRPEAGEAGEWSEGWRVQSEVEPLCP